jgi:hypothetical protein
VSGVKRPVLDGHRKITACTSSEDLGAKVLALAVQCLYSEGLLSRDCEISPGVEIDLLGPGAICDSMGLVSYLVAIEEAVRDELGADVTLLDERAMSAERSPFRSLETLVSHIRSRVEEAWQDA